MGWKLQRQHQYLLSNNLVHDTAHDAVARSASNHQVYQ
jgi:hypothetical protein